MSEEELEKIKYEFAEYTSNSYWLNIIIDIIDDLKEVIAESKQLQQENKQLSSKTLQLETQRKELINWLESKNNITLQQHKTIEPVIKVQEVIDKIKEVI